MDLHSLLDALFPGGHEVQLDGLFVHGEGKVDGKALAVVGTRDAAAIGVELALALAGGVLRVIREQPGRPILLLVDTVGQRLRRRDELLGINRFLAHLAKCIEMARRRGHRVISLVYAQGVSGGYLSSGMLTDACFALPHAEIRVMSLPAMARVTKIPQQQLEELSRTSPVFAPGVSNYLQMGALEAIWEGDLAGALVAALQPQPPDDRRRELGQARGGRKLAEAVSRRVREDGAA